jgi:hypothetical protein
MNAQRVKGRFFISPSLIFTHQPMIAMMRLRAYTIKNLSGHTVLVRETT